MISNFINIEQKIIFVPEIWKNDWDEIIKSANGVQKELLITQARAADLLTKINDTKVNFGRLAWLNLWSKAFNILDGAYCSVECHADVTLELLSRTILEYKLQVFTIFEKQFPNIDNNTNIRILNTNEIIKLEAIKRLKAYAAWCLYNDKEYIEYCIKPNILKAIYDPTPSKDFIDGFESKEELDDFEKLFGTVQIDLDEKSLNKQRSAMYKYGKENVDYISKLLSGNSELKDWYNKIIKIHNRKKKVGFSRVGFYELFNESENSICKKLDKIGMKFGYTSYQLGSMYMHGSTFLNFFQTDNESITPKIANHKATLDSKASFIGTSCNTIFVLLALIQNKLWAEKKQ